MNLVPNNEYFCKNGIILSRYDAFMDCHSTKTVKINFQHLETCQKNTIWT